MFLDRQPARRVCAALCLATIGALAMASAAAQQAPAAAVSGAELTPAERAQRDADKVFKWILIHADKPRKPNPARDEKREEKPLVAARPKPAARAAEPAPAISGAVPAPVATEATTAPVTAATPSAVVEAAVVPVFQVEARAVLPSAAPPAASVAAEAVDEILTPLFRAEPQFPANVLRTLRKGAVQLRFTVLPDGSVADAAVVTSTNARLNPSALAAIAQWRFAPLRKPQPGLVALGFDLD